MNSAEEVNAAFQMHNMKEYADRQERLKQMRKSTIEFAVGFILTSFVVGMLCVGAISQLPGLDGIMWPSLGAMGSLWLMVILIASVRTKSLSNRMLKNQSESILAALYYDVHGVPERDPFSGMCDVKESAE